MRTTFLNYWHRVRSSFWFLPGVMVAAAAVLALALVAADEALSDEWLADASWVYTGGTDGASGVLQAIAGSMITIAGLVFSMTLVTLSLASSQFGPRLLRGFMRDATNQFVLGTFVATFLYCLLVLRTIRRVEEQIFVPHLSVTVAMVLAIVNLGVLIYFIHHVAVSIQAETVIAKLGRELERNADHLFPEPDADDERRPPPPDIPDDWEWTARPVAAPADGYVQLIDTDALVALAKEADAVFRVHRRPGHYVTEGTPLVSVRPADAWTEDLAGRVAGLFVVGSYRTPLHDLELSLDELVEIAVRALSPGINDPFTAITCVDRLGSCLTRLARRDLPAPWRLDEDRRLRVVLPAHTFPRIVDAALNQIRQNSNGTPVVSIRLLEMLTTVLPAVRRDEDRAALEKHAGMIVRGALREVAEESDRRDVEERYEDFTRALAAR